MKHQDILQFDHYSCWQSEVHQTYLISTQKWPKDSQKLAKLAKKSLKNCHKRMILHSNICPLEIVFVVCFPSHLLGLSERYVLDPQTLIWDSVFMEIWLKQNRPFYNFRQKYQFFHRSRYDRSDRSKLRQNEASYEKS